MTLLWPLVVAAALRSGSPERGRFQLTPTQIEVFHREGVLVVRGLLTSTELAAAQKVGLEIVSRQQRHKPVASVGKPQHIAATGSRKRQQHALSIAALDFGQLHHDRAWQNVALSERMASVVHALMPSFDDVRVLRDAFLATAPDDNGCGWHEDDSSFWPCPKNAPGPGLNVWIALSDYKAAHGGGMGVVKGSHTARWADRVRKLINRPGNTCALASLAPRLHRRCERNACSFDLRAGDALVCSRRTLHRTLPFTEEGEEATRECAQVGEPRMRYTLRYMPGEATLDPSSPAVAAGLGGRSLRSLGHQYPRCWPCPDPEEIRALRKMRAKRAPSE